MGSLSPLCLSISLQKCSWMFYPGMVLCTNPMPVQWGSAERVPDSQMWMVSVYWDTLVYLEIFCRFRKRNLQEASVTTMKNYPQEFCSPWLLSRKPRSTFSLPVGGMKVITNWNVWKETRLDIRNGCLGALSSWMMPPLPSCPNQKPVSHPSICPIPAPTSIQPQSPECWEGLTFSPLHCSYSITHLHCHLAWKWNPLHHPPNGFQSVPQKQPDWCYFPQDKTSC
jgi:hypothetical protein